MAVRVRGRGRRARGCHGAAGRAVPVLFGSWGGVGPPAPRCRPEHPGPGTRAVPAAGAPTGPVVATASEKGITPVSDGVGVGNPVGGVGQGA